MDLRIDIPGESREHPLCLDFTNTVSYRTAANRTDNLQKPEDLVAWFRERGLDLPSHGTAGERQLARALRLREAVYAIASGLAAGGEPSDADLRVLTAELRDALLHLELAPAGVGLEWRIEGARPSVEKGLWLVALSAARIFASEDSMRVRVCRSEGCGWLFVDLSKNRSRKWCSMSDCGNVEKARRHYSRKKQLAAETAG